MDNMLGSCTKEGKGTISKIGTRHLNNTHKPPIKEGKEWHGREVGVRIWWLDLDHEVAVRRKGNGKFE
jgi:hypothetical protein